MSDRGAARCLQPAKSREMHNPGAIYSTTLCYNQTCAKIPKRSRSRIRWIQDLGSRWILDPAAQVLSRDPGYLGSSTSDFARDPMDLGSSTVDFARHPMHLESSTSDFARDPMDLGPCFLIFSRDLADF